MTVEQCEEGGRCCRVHPAPTRICSKHLDDLLSASPPSTPLSTPTRRSEKDNYFQRGFFHGLEKALSKKEWYFHLHFPSIFKDSIFLREARYTTVYLALQEAIYFCPYQIQTRHGPSLSVSLSARARSYFPTICRGQGAQVDF